MKYTWYYYVIVCHVRLWMCAMDLRDGCGYVIVNILLNE